MDLMFVYLVFCIKMIVGDVCVFVTRSWMEGMAVLSDDAFQVAKYKSWLVMDTKILETRVKLGFHAYL